VTTISTSNSNSRLAHYLQRSLSVKCDLAAAPILLSVSSLTTALSFATAQPNTIQSSDLVASRYIGAGTVKQAGKGDDTHYWLAKDRPAKGIVKSVNVLASGIFAFWSCGSLMPDQSGHAESDLTVATPARTTTVPIGIALNHSLPFRRLIPRASSPMTRSGTGTPD
jgi:hypothetical protein